MTFKVKKNGIEHGEIAGFTGGKWAGFENPVLAPHASVHLKKVCISIIISKVELILAGVGISEFDDELISKITVCPRIVISLVEIGIKSRTVAIRNTKEREAESSCG